MDIIKIFVADDSIVARNMLIRLLSNQPDLEVVGEAGSGEGCIIMLDEVNPDLVLLEAGISGSMQLEDIIREIKNFQPLTQVIICVDPGSGNDQIFAATKAGAADFISKPYRLDTVLRTIRNVAATASKQTEIK